MVDVGQIAAVDHDVHRRTQIGLVHIVHVEEHGHGHVVGLEHVVRGRNGCFPIISRRRHRELEAEVELLAENLDVVDDIAVQVARVEGDHVARGMITRMETW